MIILDKYDFLAYTIQAMVAISAIHFALKFWRKRQRKSAPGRTCVNIPKLMLDRTCKHGPCSDFRLYYASEGISPADLFNYVMNGLHWPEIHDIVQKKDHVYMYMASLNKYGEKEDLRVWFFGREEQNEFVKELAQLFVAYEKNGCPSHEVEETVESIVARARGETVDLLEKYGFVWAEGS